MALFCAEQNIYHCALCPDSNKSAKGIANAIAKGKTDGVAKDLGRDIAITIGIT